MSSSWHYQDEAFYNVTEGILKAVEEIEKGKGDEEEKVQGKGDKDKKRKAVEMN